MAVDLVAAKSHLNIVGSDDDAVLQRMIAAAKSHVDRLLGYKVEEQFEAGDVPADLDLATLQLVAHWYENREASLVGFNAQSIPFGVDEIVREHRNWSF